MGNDILRNTGEIQVVIQVKVKRGYKKSGRKNWNPRPKLSTSMDGDCRGHQIYPYWGKIHQQMAKIATEIIFQTVHLILF